MTLDALGLSPEPEPARPKTARAAAARGRPPASPSPPSSSVSSAPPSRPKTARRALSPETSARPKTARRDATPSAESAARPKTARSAARDPVTPRQVSFQLPGAGGPVNVMTFDELHSSPEVLSDMPTPPDTAPSPRAPPGGASPSPEPLPPLLRNLFSVENLQPALAAGSPVPSSPDSSASTPGVSASFQEESVGDENAGSRSGTPRESEYEYSESFVSDSLASSADQRPAATAATIPTPALASLPPLPSGPPLEFSARAPIASRVLDRDALQLLSSYDASILAMTQTLRHELDFVRQV